MQNFMQLTGSKHVVNPNPGHIPIKEPGILGQIILKKTGKTSKKGFLNAVRKGDILISKTGIFRGLIGHSAIMATDKWVVEMPGGEDSAMMSTSSSSSSDVTLEDNNRRISAEDWYDEHESDSITIYRCPDNTVACMAADWAYTHYYNEHGGDRKTIHVSYSLASPILQVTDPSYCSKLVIQSFYYGTGSRNVISLEVMVTGAVIVPSKIPSFFTSKYALKIVMTL